MKIKRLIMGGLLSLAMAVTFIPNDVLAAPQEGGETPEAVTVAEQSMEKGQVDIDLGDSDDLLMQFLEAEAGGGNSAPAQTGSAKRKAAKANRLNGNDASIYEALLEEITKIAEGERESSIIEIPAETILGQTSFTAEDLGVESILALDEEGQIIVDEEGYASFSEEAIQAFEERIAFDGSAIIHRLLVDCPYKLYWFDKTTTYYFGWNSGYGGSATEITFSKENPAVQFELKVSRDYQTDDDPQDTIVDTDKTTAARTAAVTASGIVEAHKNETTIKNRIAAYKDEICGLTAYNDDAADDEIDTPYGNPWQLIWVFDGDESTTVVCEGYSKAYQFLCDLTEFGDDVESRIVSGTMDGGKGAGDHMWNVMQMDDGANYLVDVTNCDEGTIGAPDQLFLKKGTYDEEEDQYIFTCNSGDVRYAYDDETTSLYEEDELTLSSKDYTEPTQEELDQRAANKVIAIINSVVELGDFDEDNIDQAAELIEQATAAYMALTDEQKELVENLEILEDAKARYQQYQEGGSLTPVQEVEELINAIELPETPADMTEEQAEAIVAAREAYDALSEEDQQEVGNYENLTDAERILAMNQCEELTFGTMEEVSIANAGDYVIYKFIPQTDAFYIFESSGEEDSFGILYDTAGEYIDENDDNGKGYNFCVGCLLEKGKPYYLECRMASSSETGTFQVGVTESTVTGIQFERDGKAEVGVVENRDGELDYEWDEDDNKVTFFRYELSFHNGDTLELAGSGEDCGTYTYSADRDMFLRGDGAEISAEDISVDSNQSCSAPWTDKNETYQFTLSYQGQVCTVDAHIVDNPVQSIEYKGNPWELYEGEDAEWIEPEDEGEEGYYKYQTESFRFESDAELELSGDSSIAGTYVYDADKEQFFCSDLGYSIDGDDFRDRSNQSENHWTIGDENAMIWSYEGVEFEVPVTIIENPIENMEFTPAEMDYYIYEMDEPSDDTWRWQSELTEMTGHTLTFRIDGETKVYTATKDEDSGEIVWVSEVETDPSIEAYELDFTTTDGSWIGEEEANFKVSYKGKSADFTLPIRKQIVRMEYVPGQEYVAYKNIGEENEEGIFCYTISMEKDGDQIKLYSSEEGSDPDLIFTCSRKEGNDAVWKTEDGTNLSRIGYVDFIQDNEAWAQEPTDSWEIKADFRMRSNEESELLDSIPVRYSEESPVKYISYSQADVQKLEQGVDGDEESKDYSGTMALSEGDQITVTDADDAEKTYTYSVGDEDEDGNFKTEDGEILDWDYLKIEKEDGEEAVWDLGRHYFIVSYYGVNVDADGNEVKIEVEIVENPIAKVEFTPADPMTMNAQETGRLETDADGQAYTEYRYRYLDADNYVFQAGDELKLYWKDTDRTPTVYTYDNVEWDFVDNDTGRRIPYRYWYTDDQEKPGQHWKIGENPAYIVVAGVRSEPFFIEVVCNHGLRHKDGKEATCEETGTKEYWICGFCEKLFSDAEGNDEINAPETIDPLGHDWGGWESLNENQHQRICTRNETHIEKAAHTWNEGEVTTPPTEETPGVKTFTCKDCGGTKTEPIPELSHTHNLEPHAETPATCEADGNSAYWYCEGCGKYFSDAEGKTEINEGSWVIKGGHKLDATEAKAATCEADGNSAYWTCSECGKYFSDSEGKTEIDEGSWVIKGGHKLTPTEAKPASCTEAGNRAYWYCSKCKKYYSDKEGTKAIAEGSWIIPKKAHTMKATAAKAATCTEDGNSAYWYCSECEKYYSDADGKNEISENSWIISKKGHSMQHVAAAEPTRTKSGNYEYWYCEKCKKYFKDADGTQEYEGDKWKIPATGSEEVVAAVTAAETLVGDAEKINADTYSANSYAAVKAALEALQKVLADDSSTADQITTATQNLQKAIDGLKMSQTLNVKAAKKTVKVKKLKKKAQSVKPLKVTGQKTTVTYKGKPVGKKAKKALKINAKTGKITVKKKTKKGTYKMKVTVTAAASAKYEKAVKTVTVTIKVK